MVRGLTVLVVLTGVVGFGQSRVPGTANTSPPARNSGEPDTGTMNGMQMKSIDQVLQDDPKLSAKLKALLPAELSPQQACGGFKTLEQCITAIHLAQNLKLPFADLKAKTTGKGSVGLQKAIEQMAADVNAKDEAKKAKKQAADDMKGVSLFGVVFFLEQTVSMA